MPRQIVSWGVLLFSFSLLLLLYSPQVNYWSIGFDWTYYIPDISIPIFIYYILAAITGVFSMFFLISAFWQNWSNKTEQFILKNRIHILLFIIYWFSYIASYIKGVGSLIENSSEHWIVYMVFSLGLVLFIIIPIHYLRWVNQQRKVRPQGRFSI
jgi:hypothetical protein